MINTTQLRGLTLNKVTVTSAAQLMTLAAYGDGRNGEKAGMPFRNLSFRAECEDYADFEKCMQLIESYNEFDAAGMLLSLKSYLARKKYFNDNNPNNGNDFFKFEIAREGSPAFYVSFNPEWDKRIIVGGKVTDYTVAEFKSEMEALRDFIKADEMDIEEGHKIECRFWFD